MRLDDVRVLDLTRLLPGPYATQLLADAGADVIKVEDTGAGDYARQMPPYTDRGVGAVFDAVNRGKRSVALDLKTDAGRAAFYDLVAEADVVFEGFRPGVADRLGVDYDAVREHNDEVVYCSLSGYGQDGPFADRPGHDLNYVGVAGLLDLTREDTDATPAIPGYPIADMAGGLFAAFSVVGALASRALGNTDGEYVEVAMTDAVVSLSQAVAPMALAGENPRPGETPLTGAFPWYDVYEAVDGYVTLAALEPEFWANFCEAVDREEWVGLHMTDDAAEREALRGELADLFATRTREEWDERLPDAMFAPVYRLEETLEHPQVEARDLVERPEGAPARVGFPAKGTAVGDGAGPELPDQGEHTEGVLREAGLDDADLERLREAGAIPPGE